MKVQDRRDMAQSLRDTLFRTSPVKLSYHRRYPAVYRKERERFTIMLKLLNVSGLYDLCATIEGRQYIGRVQRIEVTYVFNNLDLVYNVIIDDEFGITL